METTLERPGDGLFAVERAADVALRWILTRPAMNVPVFSQAMRRFRARRDGKGMLSDFVVERGHAWACGASLRDLAREGVLCEATVELLVRSGFPERLRLYEHQEEAIRTARQHPRGVVLVAAGTGAGKTECFLIPLLDRLVRDALAGTLSDAGVRAILLYPLNALVNDQVDRWRRLLRHQEEVLGEVAIRFGLYTSRLPENGSEAEERAQRRIEYFERHGLDPSQGAPGPGEVRHRAELRRRPPHVLVTNYSMLELSLLRPADRPLWEASARTLEHFVLDEAHVYTAALANDIRLLLRRVALHVGRGIDEMGFSFTSATLGGDREALAEFAADLASKPRDTVRVIVARRLTGVRHTRVPKAVAPPSQNAIEAMHRALDALGEQLEGKTPPPALGEALKGFGIPWPGAADDGAPWPERLASALKAFAPFVRLGAALEGHNGPVSLRSLAREVWLAGDDDVVARRATEALLRLGVVAHERDGTGRLRPLMPGRIHAVLRTPGAIGLCLSEACHGTGAGGVTLNEAPRCSDCEGPVYPVWACGGCGMWALGARLEQGPMGSRLVPLRLEDLLDEAAEEPVVVWLRPKGRPTRGEGWQAWHVRAKDGVMTDGADGATRVWVAVPASDRLRACPSCERQEPGTWWPVRLGAQTVRNTVIGALFETMPAGAGEAGLPGRGRRLLTFADSRQAAARTAPLFARSHQLFLVRAALWARICGEALSAEEEAQLEALEAQLAEPGLAPAVRTVVESAAQALRERARGLRRVGELLDSIADDAYLMRQLMAGDAPDDKAPGTPEARSRLFELVLLELCSTKLARFAGDLESLGLIEVMPAGWEQWDWGPLMRAGIEDAGVARDFAVAAVRWMRGRGAVLPQWRDVLMRDADRRVPFVGRRPLGSRLVRTVPRGEASRWVFAIAGTRARKKPLTIQIGRLAARALRACGTAPTNDQVVAVLDAFFDVLWRAAGPTEGVRRHEDGVQLVAEHLVVTPAAASWECTRCGRLIARGIGHYCPAPGCEDGKLERLEERPSHGHYMALIEALARDPVGYAAVEHTAQAASEALELEEIRFRLGERNLLSSSTTLELGVDIGDLDTVCMLNTPPSVASYRQRAGRVGRRQNGLALSLILPREGPVDLFAFFDPAGYMNRPLPRPYVYPHSERLSILHAWAHLFAVFHHEVLQLGAEGGLRLLGSCKDFFHRRRHPPRQAQAIRSLVGRVRATRCEAMVAWLERRASKDATLGSALRRLLAGTACEAKSQKDVAHELAERLQRLARQWEEERKALDEERALVEQDDELDEGQRKRALRSVQRRLEQLEDRELLALLSVEGVLPRYGFPLEVVQLRGVPEPTSPDLELRLERDVLQALREYAPGKKVIARGKAHEVHGIVPSRYAGGAATRFEMRFVHECPRCKARFDSDAQTLSQCGVCGATWDPKAVPRPIQIIVPKAFAAGEEGEEVRPGDQPAGHDVVEVEAAVDWRKEFAQLEWRGYAIDGVGTIGVAEVARLMMWAVARGEGRKGFDVCPRCGRARPAAAHGGLELGHGVKPDFPHARLSLHRAGKRGPACRVGREYLHGVSLGARFVSDGLAIALPEMIAGVRVVRAVRAGLGQALRLAAALERFVDGRQFAYRLISVPGGLDAASALLATRVSYLLVLYDRTSGGTGLLPHFAEDASEFSGLWERAVQLVASCPLDCECACAACLISADVQFERLEFDRRLVCTVLTRPWCVDERSSNDSSWV